MNVLEQYARDHHKVHPALAAEIQRVFDQFEECRGWDVYNNCRVTISRPWWYGWLKHKLWALLGTVVFAEGALNGDIDLTFEKISEGQSVALESVNGAIRLRIPAKANGRVEAETLNGNVSNEFGLTVEKGQWVGRSMEGLMGSGGARIALETVNGSIDIKKR